MLLTPGFFTVSSKSFNLPSKGGFNSPWKKRRIECGVWVWFAKKNVKNIICHETLIKLLFVQRNVQCYKYTPELSGLKIKISSQHQHANNVSFLLWLIPGIWKCRMHPLTSPTMATLSRLTEAHTLETEPVFGLSSDKGKLKSTGRKWNRKWARRRTITTTTTTTNSFEATLIEKSQQVWECRHEIFHVEPKKYHIQMERSYLFDPTMWKKSVLTNPTSLWGQQTSPGSRGLSGNGRENQQEKWMAFTRHLWWWLFEGRFWMESMVFWGRSIQESFRVSSLWIPNMFMSELCVPYFHYGTRSSIPHHLRKYTESRHWYRCCTKRPFLPA